jgi:Flp pilus assembly protein TadD
VQETAQETVQETAQALEEPIVVAVPAEAEVEAVAEVEGEAREIASEATIEKATIEEATIEVATLSPEVGIGESLPIERVEQVSTAVESNPLADPVVVTEAPVTSQPIDQPVEVPVPTEQPTSIAELDLGEDVQLESMKEAPRYSNEQLDTIAVQEALRLISAGNTEAAFDTLGQYIIENRNAHQSRETYAKLLMNQGRGNDAAALIDAGLDLAPNHSGFKKVKARLLMGSGNIPDAVDILISRAPDIVDDSEYHDLLASAQLSSRDFAGAVISYRGLVEYDQSQGKWWYGYAAANDQLGNTSIARQAYSRAMQFSNLSANLRRRSQERVGTLNP